MVMRMMRRYILRHAESELTNAAEHAPERSAQVRGADLLLQQPDRQWIECVNVFLEAFSREIGVAFEHVDNNRPPGDYVTLLSFFFEDDERANDVGA